jgi:DNA-3-methyladenine glycosylase
MGAPKPLPKSFYRRETAEVARALLGCRLTRHLPDGSERSVLLVETEAYLGVKDRAAQTWTGRRTPRVAPMWGEGGHAYVYFVYGMHFCMNVVTQKEGVPEAVLLRAGVPEIPDEDKEKTSLVKRAGARGRPSSPSKKSSSSLLASGPAKLCEYLQVTRELSGASFAGPELILSRGPRRRFNVLVGPRIGVDYAGAAAAWPLRFAIADCTAVTRPKGLRPFTS